MPWKIIVEECDANEVPQGFLAWTIKFLIPHFLMSDLFLRIIDC